MTKPRGSSATKMTPVKSATAKGAAGTPHKPRRPRSTKAAAKPETLREAIGPIAEGNRRVLVVQVMETMRNGGRPGNKPQVWALGVGLLMECGMRAVSGTESIQAIIRSVEPDLKKAKVTARSMQRFLENLRSMYRDFTYRYTAKFAKNEVVAACNGDHAEMNRLLNSTLLSDMLKTLEANEFGTMSTADKHVALRLSETIANSAKIEADARLKDAQIAKMADHLLMTAQKRSETTPGGKRRINALGMTREQLIQKMHEALTGEGPSPGGEA